MATRARRAPGNQKADKTFNLSLVPIEAFTPVWNELLQDPRFWSFSTSVYYQRITTTLRERGYPNLATFLKDVRMMWDAFMASGEDGIYQRNALELRTWFDARVHVLTIETIYNQHQTFITATFCDTRIPMSTCLELLNSVRMNEGSFFEGPAAEHQTKNNPQPSLHYHVHYKMVENNLLRGFYNFWIPFYSDTIQIWKNAQLSFIKGHEIHEAAEKSFNFFFNGMAVILKKWEMTNKEKTPLMIGDKLFFWDSEERKYFEDIFPLAEPKNSVEVKIRRQTVYDPIWCCWRDVKK